MKKSRILAAAALALALAVTVAAGDDKMAKLTAELNLTDAQATQLEQKFKELQPLSDRAKAIKEDLKALESASTPDPKAIQAKKAELETIKKDWHGKSTAIFRSVLNKEQWTKYEAMEAEHAKSAQAKKY